MDACYNAKGHPIDSRYELAPAAVPAKVVQQADVRDPGRYERDYASR